MNQENNRKLIDTSEWYDFIGQLSDVVPGIHLGGLKATHTLLDMCQLDGDSYVLDVGCGSGLTACLITQKYGARVMGIDISEVMIAQAEKRANDLGLSDRITFKVADVFHMPFDNDMFDVAIAESVLTPLPGDKVQALTEIARVVQPGGRIGINESTIDASAPPELAALMDEHPAIHGYFTPEKLRSLFESAGLQVMQMTKGETAESESALKSLGLRGFISFMIKAYPKVLLKLLRDARFRKASQIDDKITKLGKPYMAYYLVIGQKQK